MYKFDFSYSEYNDLLNKCPFTDEEIEIFKLKRRGKSNVYIAIELGLSERTINNRIKSIVKKILKEAR